MTEELEQKAKDFIDRIGKESGGNWLDKYYLTDLLVMFVTEETKELQDKLANADYQLEGRDLEVMEFKAELEREKNLNQCLSDHNEQLRDLIEKIKSDSKTAYIKGIRTMANALKEYDRTEGSWTDYFEHTVDKVLKNLLKEYTMFEKEAEEYADEKCGTIETDEKMFCKLDWQKGAEFGYNKANEWQYVSEKGFPKDEKTYFVIIDYGALGRECTVMENLNKDKPKKVIAWKEIVLPELPKESE